MRHNKTSRHQQIAMNSLVVRQSLEDSLETQDLHYVDWDPIRYLWMAFCWFILRIFVNVSPKAMPLVSWGHEKASLSILKFRITFKCPNFFWMFKLFTQNNSLPVRQRKTQLNQLLDVIFITKRTILILHHHMKSCGAKCIHFQTKPSEQVRLAKFLT